MQAVMPQLFTQAMGGTAIEVFVQQDPRPDRHPQRAFRDHARCWGRRHNAGDLRTLTGLLVTRALDASNMGLDLDFDDGGFFGTGKRCERLAACWAVFRRLAQVMHFGHHREGGAITAAVALTARLLPPISWS